MKHVLTTVAAIVGWLGIFAAAPALAHDPGLSLGEFNLRASGLDIHLTFARRDIDALGPFDIVGDGKATSFELDGASKPLAELVRQALAITVDGRAVEGRVTGLDLDDSDALHMRLAYPPMAAGRLQIAVAIVADMKRGHRHFAILKGADGARLAEHMLSPEAATFTHELAAASAADAAASKPAPLSLPHYLMLGLEHIATGYDHLLFLLGLLVVGGSLRSAVYIITSFTVAHSISLAVATLGDIDLPPRIVEPLIAASIIYVAVENLWRRDLAHRWKLTFAFGLIHGLGFASILRELGVKGSDALSPLLAFNLGVEIGQVAIAVMVMPLLTRLLDKTPRCREVAAACSLLLALTGAYWLAERTILA